jgi:amidase
MGSSDPADVSAAREPDANDSPPVDPIVPTGPHQELDGATVTHVGSSLRSGEFSIRELVERYLERIKALDRHGPRLLSVIEINPEAIDIADALDHELRTRGPRGPLHGIPVLLKDNIDTADQMLTTAGSLALVNSRPPRDAFVVKQLREAGAVLLGKTNMSEWANFRSSRSSSGWSARGGQCRNPYDLHVSPCGSSSGSAVAVAAALAAVAVGTETDGSIVCPASVNSVVGIKPTLGLVSRAGVIPIAHSQDTVGPFGRSVSDAAALLGVLAGADPGDAVTMNGGESPRSQGESGSELRDYSRFLDPEGLRGARIGVPRTVYWGNSEKSDVIAEAAVSLMRTLGAEIIDPADIPTAEAMLEEPGEMEVLWYEFKHDLDAYLAERDDPTIHSLGDLIRFNDEHAREELRYFGQEHFLRAQEKGPLTDSVYRDALARNHRLSRQEGIDAVMEKYQLDALVTPTQGPPWAIDLVNGDHDLGPTSSTPAALAGYPIVSVPAGYAFERPVGISFLGRPYSEPTLIRLAYAFEQAACVRQPPRFLSAHTGELSMDLAASVSN